MLLDHDVPRADGDDGAIDLHSETTGAAQQATGPKGLVPTVVDVGLPPAVHHERVTSDPDPSIRMVLRVEHEHAAGADHQMVDVGALAAHPGSNADNAIQ